MQEESSADTRSRGPCPKTLPRLALQGCVKNLGTLPPVHVPSTNWPDIDDHTYHNRITQHQRQAHRGRNSSKDCYQSQASARTAASFSSFALSSSSNPLSIAQSISMMATTCRSVVRRSFDEQMRHLPCPSPLWVPQSHFSSLRHTQYGQEISRHRVRAALYDSLPQHHTPPFRIGWSDMRPGSSMSYVSIRFLYNTSYLALKRPKDELLISCTICNVKSSPVHFVARGWQGMIAMPQKGSGICCVANSTFSS